jgi:serine/threonine protein kinase
MMVGTWAYMAPERFTAGTADARSDVYALACVLYECLTGTTPYAGGMEQQIAGHLTLDPPKPSQQRPDLPVRLDEVIAKGMAKKPDERYQSARELATAAHHALTSSRVPEPTPAASLLANPPRPAPGSTLLDEQKPPPTADATQPQPADAIQVPEPGRKSAATREVIQRDKLGPRTKIGQGGQGVVYRAPNVKTKFAASMVYKEYKAAARTEIDFTALAAMPALVEESLTYTQAERLISIAAWPCAIVEDAGTPTGFVMPAIPQEFFISLTTAKGVASTTAEFQHLLNHSSILAARGITLDDVQRFTLLREVASGLAFMHKHGVCVGDISPKNLLFSLTPHEAVYFIDCDAMRINGVSALPQVETPGWEVPFGEELATIYSDAYKLGLLALRLVAGEHDTKSPQHLPSTTPALLRQIITDTLNNAPQQRPLPEAWTYVLGHAIEHAQHQKKTTSPVGAPQTPPPIPIVHSRPTAHSAPPVRPSEPPPSAPPTWAPPVSGPPSSRAPIWAAGGVVAAVVIVASVVIAVALAKHNTGAPSSAPQTSSTEPSSSSAQTSSTEPFSSSAQSSPPTQTPGPGQMSGHYIDTETYAPTGQTTTNDWYFTPCGDGCADAGFGQARLVNGQWTMEVTSNATCSDGSSVQNANTDYYTWDPNTLAGTAQVTTKLAACGRSPGESFSVNVQLRQVS